VGDGRGGAGQGARAGAPPRRGSSDAAESDAAAAKSEAYEDVCGAWWAEVQEHARGQAAAAAGRATRVLEYSLLFDDRLAIWVLSGAGELLGSATVPSTGFGGTTGRTVRDLLQEARGSMDVRGREAMASVSAELNQERNDQQSDDGIEQGEASSERGNKCKVCGLRFHLCVCQETKEKTTTAADEVTCKVCLSKPCTCAADEAREQALLRELYAALLAPVEEHLTGAEEVLIVPHKELFEVPWAALIDAHGHFLIERHVLRVAPSLRVAQQAADSAAQGSARRPGHIVLVGNPLPIRSGFDSLPYAQQEAQGVHDSLKRANVLVKPEHFYIGLGSDSHPKATKANVKKSLEDAGWAHLALHSDKDTKTLVLAVPESKSDPDHAQPDLSMLEVQGSDEAADKRERVRLAEGATVVLSACNTGRGDILAEGVVGLARGFLLAGAAAAVVSLWSVDDGSTAALMEQMYRHLVEGCTVPQALRDVPAPRGGLHGAASAAPRHAPPRPAPRAPPARAARRGDGRPRPARRRHCRGRERQWRGAGGLQKARGWSRDAERGRGRRRCGAGLARIPGHFGGRGAEEQQQGRGADGDRSIPCRERGGAAGVLAGVLQAQGGANCHP